MNISMVMFIPRLYFNWAPITLIYMGTHNLVILNLNIYFDTHPYGQPDNHFDIFELFYIKLWARTYYLPLYTPVGTPQ